MTATHPRYYESLGRAITLLRTEQGLDRKELAERAGISYSYLAEIENGNKPPSSRVLLEIANALGLGMTQLMASAESLLTRQEGETVVAPLSAPAARSPSRTWFHQSADPGDPYAKSSKRDELAEELSAIAKDLRQADLERVVDLARRLRRDTSR